LIPVSLWFWVDLNGRKLKINRALKFYFNLGVKQLGVWLVQLLAQLPVLAACCSKNAAADSLLCRTERANNNFQRVFPVQIQPFIVSSFIGPLA